MIERRVTLPLRRMLEYWDEQSWPIVITIGLACVGILGIVDFLTGYEISSSLFYLLPISFGAWYAGKRAGVAISIISAITWEEVGRLGGITYSHPAIPYWNALTRLGFFIIVTVLLSILKQELEREQELSRTDSLTGANNFRAFKEMAVAEIARASRYARPFTVVYIDIDDFKVINDRLGHNMGDALLQVVVRTLRANTRTTDSVARLGGDEFAILLPETGDKNAEGVISKIHQGLLDEMQKHQWPVTFSIGVLTCIAIPHTYEEMIKRVDDLMYIVKTNGKNAINYSIYAG
jgi:diguanylate cyclase (GGDEF)-like protein